MGSDHHSRMPPQKDDKRQHEGKGTKYGFWARPARVRQPPAARLPCRPRPRLAGGRGATPRAQAADGARRPHRSREGLSRRAEVLRGEGADVVVNANQLFAAAVVPELAKLLTPQGFAVAGTAA